MDSRTSSRVPRAKAAAKNGTDAGAAVLSPRVAKRTITAHATVSPGGRHWQVSVRVVPGWGRHFVVCVKRGFKKLIRRRRQMYAKFASVAVASVVCGIVCRLLRSDRNMLAILYMLCNSLFATVVATGSIDVLGDRQERELLAHEAASGVKGSA